MSLSPAPIPLSYHLQWLFWYLGCHGIHHDLTQWPEPDQRASSYDIEIGFLGDLMGLGAKDLEMGDEIIQFFSDCPNLIFNLEGLIHPNESPVLFTQTTNHTRALEHLRKIYTHRLIAGLANNHTDDLNEAEVLQNLELIKKIGMEPLGWKDHCSLTLAPGLKLTALTSWVGAEPSMAAAFSSQHLQEDQHLLFLHYGHEFHRHPKAQVVQGIESLPANVLAMIGHHSHFPQRIQTAPRFIAWSLGNLAVKYGGRPVNWGIALKLQLQKQAQQWVLAGWQWRLVKNTPSGSKVKAELHTRTAVKF